MDQHEIASFEDREAATRRLAAFGHVAKDALLEAIDSGNPETKTRAKNILYRLFPKCLRFEGER